MSSNITINKFIAKVAIHQIFKNDFPKSQQIVDRSKSRILKLLTKILKDNPSFGVFTTVDRSPETKKKANTDLVHGCHGTFGDGDYKPLSPEEMLNHILDKVYSSAHSDSRKNQFTQSLKDDSNGYVKIALLKLPLYEIDFASGVIPKLKNRIFKNDKLGFIMDKNGNKATYLPEVFPNKSWQEIRDHLVQNKAGSSLDKNIKFFAYKTFDIKSTIGEALKLKLSNLNTILKKPTTSSSSKKTKTNNNNSIKSKSFNNSKKVSKTGKKISKTIDGKTTSKTTAKLENNKYSKLSKSINKEQLSNIYQFFVKYYQKEIPYEVASKSNNDILVTSNKNQYVRNYASYSDILKLLKLLKKPKTDILFKRVLLSIKKEVVPINISKRQAYPFLLISLYQMNNNNKFSQFIDEIETFLYNSLQNLKESNIDMNFELGEIMMGLCKTYNSNKKINLEEKKRRKAILDKVHREMFVDLQKLGYNSSDIFRYNWHCQTVCQYYNAFQKDSLIKDSKDKLFIKHVSLLKKYLNKYISENITNLENLETNFLAVTFEAYAALINIMKHKNAVVSQQIILNTIKLKEILDTRFTDYGLLKFTSGDSRIDITGHVINGIYNLK